MLARVTVSVPTAELKKLQQLRRRIRIGVSNTFEPRWWRHKALLAAEVALDAEYVWEWDEDEDSQMALQRAVDAVLKQVRVSSLRTGRYRDGVRLQLSVPTKRTGELDWEKFSHFLPYILRDQLEDLVLEWVAEHKEITPEDDPDASDEAPIMMVVEDTEEIRNHLMDLLFGPFKGERETKRQAAYRSLMAVDDRKGHPTLGTFLKDRMALGKWDTKQTELNRWMTLVRASWLQMIELELKPRLTRNLRRELRK